MSNLLKKIWLKKSKILFFSTFCIGLKKKFAHSLYFGEHHRSGRSQKWAMWANRSGCSHKMSDHERFAQVAQMKWGIVSESLRSLTKNERIARFFEWIAHLLIFGQKPVIRSENRWANSQPWDWPTSNKKYVRLLLFFGSYNIICLFKIISISEEIIIFHKKQLKSCFSSQDDLTSIKYK